MPKRKVLHETEAPISTQNKNRPKGKGREEEKEKANNRMVKFVKSFIFAFFGRNDCIPLLFNNRKSVRQLLFGNMEKE